MGNLSQISLGAVALHSLVVCLNVERFRARFSGVHPRTVGDGLVRTGLVSVWSGFAAGKRMTRHRHLRVHLRARPARAWRGPNMHAHTQPDHGRRDHPMPSFDFDDCVQLKANQVKFTRAHGRRKHGKARPCPRVVGPCRCLGTRPHGDRVGTCQACADRVRCATTVPGNVKREIEK